MPDVFFPWDELPANSKAMTLRLEHQYFDKGGYIMNTQDYTQFHTTIRFVTGTSIPAPTVLPDGSIGIVHDEVCGVCKLEAQRQVRVGRDASE